MNTDFEADMELIDTQWDVNVEEPHIHIVQSGGINRYIVGCKYVHKNTNVSRCYGN